MIRGGRHLPLAPAPFSTPTTKTFAKEPQTPHPTPQTDLQSTPRSKDPFQNQPFFKLSSLMNTFSEFGYMKNSCSSCLLTPHRFGQRLPKLICNQLPQPKTLMNTFSEFGFVKNSSLLSPHRFDQPHHVQQPIQNPTGNHVRQTTASNNIAKGSWNP